MAANPAEIFFQMIALLFAISLHEAAHAWTASRCGDPTARMLGRVTLNPIKHIDPIGTLLLPLLAIWTRLPLLGWGKPTPVTTSNLKNPVRDDILVSVAGPVSNVLAALAAVVVFRLILLTNPGLNALKNILAGNVSAPGVLTPLLFLLIIVVEINVVLAVFNLIPVPPLDGSHVIRHFLSGAALRVYDGIGMVGLVVLVFFGGKYLAMLIRPVDGFFKYLLIAGLHG